MEKQPVEVTFEMAAREHLELAKRRLTGLLCLLGRLDECDVCSQTIHRCFDRFTVPISINPSGTVHECGDRHEA